MDTIPHGPLESFAAHGAAAQRAVDVEIEKVNKDALKQRTGEAIRKGALASALDSALNVVCETQKEIRTLPLTSGERQALAVTLEQMGRLCFSVARECERAKPCGHRGCFPDECKHKT